MFVQIVRRAALRRHLILTTALCGAALLPNTAAAQQMGDFGTITGTVGGGTTVNVDGSTLNVGAQGNGIVNWNDFNIREGRTANFRNRDGASAPTISILNRVNGATGTDISGTLNSDSNVNVYIINRNGVVFGVGARVNVGGLVASTLDLDDTDFLNGDQSLNFIGNVGATTGINVNAGATFDVPGNLVMLGAYVNTQAPVTAGGDLAFVAGNDIIVQSSVGNPLKFVINRGTAVPNAIRVNGDLKGQNVTLAMATRSGVNNALMYIDGSIEANGVRANETGIQLVAGYAGARPNVDTASNSETQGRVGITQQGGSIRSSAVGVYAGESINIAGDASAIYTGTQNSSYVMMSSLFGDTNVGNVSSSYDVILFGNSVRANDLSSDNSNIRLSAADGGLVAINGNVSTPQSLAVTGGAVYLGSDDDAETFTIGGSATITSTSGAIYGGKGLAIQRSSGSNRDLTLSAATDIMFDPSSSILLSSAGATSALLKLSTGSAADRIALGDVTAQGITGLQSRVGEIRFGNLNLIDSLEAATTSGSIFGGSILTNGFVALDASGSIGIGAVNAGSFAQLIARDAVSVNGDVRATVISLFGDRVGAGNLTADNAVQVESLLDQMILGNVSGQNVLLKSANHLTVGDLTARGSATLTAGGFAMVNGNATVAQDYTVKGAEVRLGDDADVELQKVGGNVSITATAGSIVGGSGLKLWSLGKTTLNAATDIAFAPDSAIQAGQHNAWRQVALTTGTAADRIALGDVSANVITGLAGRQNSVVLGNISTVQALNIGTSAGDITTGNLLVDQGVSTITNSAGNITVGNARAVNGSLTLSSAANVVAGNVDINGALLLDARNVTAGDVTSLAGLADIRAWDGDASIGILRGYNVRVTAAGTGNVTIDRIGSTTDTRIETTGNMRLTGKVATNTVVNGNLSISAKSIAFGGNQPMTVKATSADLHATGDNVQIAAGTTLTTTGATVLRADRGSVVMGGDLAAGTATLAAYNSIDLGGNITANTLAFTNSPLSWIVGADVTQSGGILKVGTLSASGIWNLDLASANQIARLGDFFVGWGDLNNIGDLAIGGEIQGLDAKIRTSGTLTFEAGGHFGQGMDMQVSTNRLVNLAGAGAMGFDGRWKIFLQSPEGNDFGGLDSGNTAIWGKTLDSDMSGVTGNRYVFAYRPTLTFTSLDAGKTYGDDATALLAGRYSVSGLQQGVAGAFLGDTLASAFAGSPLLSSLGIAVNADVAGGPYAIEIGLGSLSSDAGYDFAFDSAGRLSIARKAVTAHVAIDNKTYDGTTSGSGRIGLDGVLAGDDVGANATYTFADKNAGTAKSVAITGFALSGGDAGNYSVTVPASVLADILRKAVNVSATVDNKTYDGTAAAAGRIAADGLIAGDDVDVRGGRFAFGDKNAGSGKAVLVSGISVTGADAENYRFTIPTSAVADILRKAVTVQIAADSKTYDGTTGATGRITGIDGIIAGDDFTASGGRYAFADKNAGAGKSVGVSGIALGGVDVGNYEVTVPRSALADILRRTVHVSVAVDDKSYDGTNAATGRVTRADGLVTGDDVMVAGGSYAFADKNAGTDKNVGVSDIGLSGGDAGNYNLVVPTSVLADILRKAVTVTVTVDNKTYDGTTVATGRVAAEGVVQGDDVRLSGGSYAFADKNAGARKAVVVSGLAANGADADNYDFAFPVSAVADVLRKAVTLTVTVDDKTYDGTTNANGRITGLTGVIAGDELTASAGGYAFADKNAGQGKQVGVSGISIGGVDAGNYEVAVPTSVLANILRKSLGVAITADGKVYDGTTAASGRVTGLSGAIGDDAVSVGGGSYVFADKNAGQGKKVAANGLILSGADAGNYEIGPVAAALADISRRAVTVRANDVTVNIFDRDPALGYAVTNGSLAQGDGFTGTLSRAPGHAPGAYAIGRGTLALSPNYELTYVPGTMTIEIGNMPARLLPLSLYQTAELGGRAAALHPQADPLFWVPMVGCAEVQGEAQCAPGNVK